ncbi:MAG: ADP-ribose pyrophosphatase [Candidatus Taylorbacteria bacterium]|nr:ADP-ribose pyrophosphatase [Candidatus Taylorbacteria bacterium]
MKIIRILREHDIFPERSPRSDDSYHLSREAVRIVLVDSENRVAVIHYPPNDVRGDWYELPGGGIDASETAEEALVREALEETGCAIVRCQEIGRIIEYGIRPDSMQDNHCFYAEVSGEKGKPRFTEQERQEFMQVVWLTFPAAHAIILDQVPRSLANARSLLLLELGLSMLK